MENYELVIDEEILDENQEKKIIPDEEKKIKRKKTIEEVDFITLNDLIAQSNHLLWRIDELKKEYRKSIKEINKIKNALNLLPDKTFNENLNDNQ